MTNKIKGIEHIKRNVWSKFKNSGGGKMGSPISHSLCWVHPKDRIKFWNIAIGDEVQVISGKDKGRQGKVIEIDKWTNRLKVEGLKMCKKYIPKVLRTKDMTNNVIEMPMFIHYSNVRLIGEIPGEKYGTKKLVVVKHINRGNLFYNKDRKILTWRRWVVGENKFLPWPVNLPKDEKEREQRYKEYKNDTKAANVWTKTFTPTLYSPPIPLSIEDELRNKYSKYRLVKKNIEKLSIQQFNFNHNSSSLV
ncbi:ribosomal protein L24 [Pneumocystis jirovecii RU7]|uniref:Ribosomal protein L24 n=1 Tax=Pneumocystis jirovecii (strain RU7) TaxID=1408657 RepID=A0A0W4ZV16_PNEJ7|nr:ribosomal protein L24 [Pneumocystis jirovecii RU7]KTW32220.1 ribosomal protein L24 [Pneumocystis jirovecii RU7]